MAVSRCGSCWSHLNPSFRTLIVDAGMPIHCVMTDPRQIPSMFERGAVVSFDVMDGATFSAE